MHKGPCCMLTCPTAHLDRSVPHGSVQTPDAWDAGSFSAILTSAQTENHSCRLFVHFPFLLTLDSSSTSFFQKVFSCLFRKNCGLVGPKHNVFVKELMFTWKLVDLLVSVVQLLFFLSCVLVDALRSSCVSCVTGSDRTSRCAGAGRTKGRESEKLSFLFWFWFF